MERAGEAGSGSQPAHHVVRTGAPAGARGRAQDGTKAMVFCHALDRLLHSRSLEEYLQVAIAANAVSGRWAAMLIFDLDSLKHSLRGAGARDQCNLLLELVARRLRTDIGHVATVTYPGANGLVVVLEGLSVDCGQAIAKAEATGRAILAAVVESVASTGNGHDCMPTAGVTLFGGQSESFGDIFNRAELALRSARSSGRAGLRFY